MDPSEVGGMFKNTKSQPGQIEIISGNFEVCKKDNYRSAAMVIQEIKVIIIILITFNLK